MTLQDAFDAMLQQLPVWPPGITEVYYIEAVLANGDVQVKSETSPGIATFNHVELKKANQYVLGIVDSSGSKVVLYDSLEAAKAAFIGCISKTTYLCKLIQRK